MHKICLIVAIGLQCFFIALTCSSHAIPCSVLIKIGVLMFLVNNGSADAQEDDALNYPEGLVLVQSSGENSVVVGPHIRGSRLRASAAGFGEVDLLLPGTAR